MDEAKGVIRTIATAEDPSLVRCFRGHQKAVTSVDFSQDMQFCQLFRKQVVSGGAEGIVEVWSFKPQIRPFRFAGHKGPVHDVLFNAQATKVFSCGEDREIRIWKNTVNGKNKAVKAHSGAVLKLALSRQEDFLISCSSDKTVKMWNPDGKFKQSFTGHTNWVRECCISPDQRMILSCSDDKSVRLWDIQKSVVSANFNEHKSSVLSCKFSPDGTCVAGASSDGTIKVWDTRLSKMIQHYNAHDSAVNEICFHPLGCHMASVSDDNKIKIWDLKKGTLQWTLYGHQGNIKCLNFSEKGDYFATGGSDKLVMVWMTNFDKEMNEKGRRVQSNFREKIDGNGVQPLFKSNIINYKGSVEQENETNINNQQGQIQRDRQQTSLGLSKRGAKIAQVVSFELQKMVNQLDFLTRTLDTMDKHLTEHEQIIDRLENNEQVDNILCQMDDRKLLVPTIYNSAWEAERQLEKQAEQVEREIENQSEDEDGQQREFLIEEERKKKAFKEHMDEEEGLRFSASEINKEF